MPKHEAPARRGRRSANAAPAVPADSPARAIAMEFDEVFDHAFSASRTPHRLPARGPKHFFLYSDSIRLDRDAVSHYASESVHAEVLEAWFKASRLPRRKDLWLSLCVNASTLSRTPPEKEMDPVLTERMFRQADLMVRAAEVFGEEGPTWMTKPHPLLDNKTPAEFAGNEYGGEKVRSILNAIEHGGVV